MTATAPTYFEQSVEIEHPELFNKKGERKKGGGVKG